MSLKFSYDFEIASEFLTNIEIGVPVVLPSKIPESI